MEKIINELNQLLKRQTELKCTQEAMLKDLGNEKHILLASRAKGSSRIYYYSRMPGEKKKHYIGNASSPEVQKIANKRFLKESLSRLDSNISAIDSFVSTYRSIDFDDIIASLPKAYRNTTGTFNLSKAPAAEEWQKKKLAYKENFPVKFPDALKFSAVDGTKVRSKSEVLIANMLAFNNIPYIYECPIVIEGIPVYVDFTALSVADNRTEIIIEHQGMMGNDDYSEKHLKKLKLFLGAHIVPNRDVFFTFDDLEGGFDANVVQDIIEKYLK